MSNLPTVNDIAQQRELLAQQRELLMAHRNNLNYLLQQAAAYGGLPFAPLATANSIAAARAGIAQAKAALRAQSVIEPTLFTALSTGLGASRRVPSFPGLASIRASPIFKVASTIYFPPPSRSICWPMQSGGRNGWIVYASI